VHPACRCVCRYHSFQQTATCHPVIPSYPRRHDSHHRKTGRAVVRSLRCTEVLYRSAGRFMKRHQSAHCRTTSASRRSLRMTCQTCRGRSRRPPRAWRPMTRPTRLPRPPSLGPACRSEGTQGGSISAQGPFLHERRLSCKAGVCPLDVALSAAGKLLDVHTVSARLVAAPLFPAARNLLRTLCGAGGATSKQGECRSCRGACAGGSATEHAERQGAVDCLPRRCLIPLSKIGDHAFGS